MAEVGGKVVEVGGDIEDFAENKKVPQENFKIQIKHI
jgi:hypothetical protein